MPSVLLGAEVEVREEDGDGRGCQGEDTSGQGQKTECIVRS